LDPFTLLFDKLTETVRFDSPVIMNETGSEVFNVDTILSKIEDRTTKLIALGCKAGEVILTTYLNDDPEFVITEFAIAKLGAIHFPVSISDLKCELPTLIQHAYPGTIICNNKPVVRWLERELSRMGIIATGIRLIYCNGDVSTSSIPIKGNRAEIELCLGNITPSCLLLTSGSTSAQKIVALTHENLNSTFVAFSETDLILTAKKYLNILPLYFSGGRKVHYSCMLAGKEICYYDHRSSLKNSLNASSADLTAGTPYILEKIISEKPVLEKPVNFICGGAPLDIDIIRKAKSFGINVFNVYGLTETSSVLAYNTISENKDGSVGKVSEVNKIRFSERNEILVKGPNLFLGYVSQRKIYQSGFVDGWFNTGDTGFTDDDGFLFLTGRTNDIIKLSNGKSINMTEVEGILRGSLFPHNCWIVQREPGNFGVVIVPGQDTEINIDQVMDAIRSFNLGSEVLIESYLIETESPILDNMLKDNRSNFTRKYVNVLFSQIK